MTILEMIRELEHIHDLLGGVEDPEVMIWRGHVLPGQSISLVEHKKLPSKDKGLQNIDKVVVYLK